MCPASLGGIKSSISLIFALTTENYPAQVHQVTHSCPILALNAAFYINTVQSTASPYPNEYCSPPNCPRGHCSKGTHANGFSRRKHARTSFSPVKAGKWIRYVCIIRPTSLLTPPRLDVTSNVVHPGGHSVLIVGEEGGTVTALALEWLSQRFI